MLNIILSFDKCYIKYSSERHGTFKDKPTFDDSTTRKVSH